MVKRIIAGICILLLTLLSASYFTACDKEDKPSEGLEFTLCNDGESYSVSGRGTCKDSRIVVPSTYEDLPVTEVDASAFYGDSLKAVVLPDSIQTIGIWAFKNCKDLGSVGLPEGLTTISSGAFSGCERIRELELPTTLTSIGSKAFQLCRNLSKVIIPDGVKAIGDEAFLGCYNITTLTLGEELSKLGKAAFKSCWSIRDIVITGKVIRIMESTFEDCRALESLVLSQNIICIDALAFKECSALSSLTYDGTKEKFARVLLMENWRTESAVKEVVCTDGIVVLDPK